MKKISIHTTCKKMLADVFTPVSIYLRLRDRFRDTILLESTDHHAADNSWSFIGINAIAGMEIRTPDFIEFKLPGQKPEPLAIKNHADVPGLLFEFMQHFEATGEAKEARFAQGLYGYTSYDAVRFFDQIELQPDRSADPSVNAIPLMRYRLYQYVIAINHHKDVLYLCENKIAGIESDLDAVESLIRSKDVPVFPFSLKGTERSNMSDEAYVEMVKHGIKSCMRGDVFQI